MGIDRREFLKGSAAAAGAVFIHGSWLPAKAAERMRSAHGSALRGIGYTGKHGRHAQARFGFMFPDLPALGDLPIELTDALAETMRDPDPGGVPGDNAAVPAGFTFLGQFIDHDLTMDRSPLGEQLADPDGARNFRQPQLNLDSVYATLQPDGESLGAQFAGARFILQENENGVEDLPRNEDGTAQIADPRNEENLIILQLHMAFMRFHNRLVDEEGATFEEAQRLTRYHYQWMIVHDFLPHIIGQAAVDAVIEESRGAKPHVRTSFYRPSSANRLFMPLEFAVAAFRFGHSMVRNAYNINLATRVAIQQPVAGANLNGFRPIPADKVLDARNFFRFADSPPGDLPPFNVSKRMDAVISPNLFALPAASLPNALDRVSLPGRNLQRSIQVGLPSGQAVARAIGAEVHGNDALRPGASVLADPRFGGEAPLWFYLLAESAITENGVHLGPVGATLVAETFAGIMDADRTSYFSEPRWRPMSEPFRMQELLEFARAARPT